MLFSCFSVLGFTVVVAVVFGAFLPVAWAIPVFPISAVLALIGPLDLAQPVHSIRRNYPIIGRMRWFFEDIRPEIRQYLIEDDHERLPFSRSQRSLVYARSKNESSERAFGTQLDVYESGYEFIGHSNRPVPAGDPATFRVDIGGGDCGQPSTWAIQ